MKKLICAVTVLAVSTAQAATIHVDDDNCPGPGDGSELDPYCSVQTAIDNAVDTDEIVVAPGTYFETINLLGKAIWLHSSGGPDVTTIDAQQMNGYGLGLAGHPDAGSVVTCDSREGSDTVLEGFALTDGTGTFVEMILRGGGMYNVGSSPTVTNCMFIGNSARLFGMGGGMYNESSSPTVTNCTFSGNSAGDGGGMHNRTGSSPTVTNCTFSGNFVSGAFTRGSGGGMYNLGSSPTVTNCSFSGNSAFDTGGGMYNKSSSPTVTNCTFSGNTANGFGGGGGMYNFGRPFPAMPTVSNCILWGDSLGEISGTGTPTVQYSNIQGGFPGIGNIDADPLFVDPDNGDYRLSAGSPCIDAGNNNAIVNLTDTDLDGNPRFADDPNTSDTGCGLPVVVDMGAYEYQGVPAEVVFGDLNGDGIATFIGDLMILNGCVGSDDPDCCVADLDLDGVVGMSDRILMWGELIEFLPVR